MMQPRFGRSAGKLLAARRDEAPQETESDFSKLAEGTSAAELPQPWKDAIAALPAGHVLHGVTRGELKPFFDPETKRWKVDLEDKRDGKTGKRVLQFANTRRHQREREARRG